MSCPTFKPFFCQRKARRRHRPKVNCIPQSPCFPGSSRKWPFLRPTPITSTMMKRRHRKNVRILQRLIVFHLYYAVYRSIVYIPAFLTIIIMLTEVSSFDGFEYIILTVPVYSILLLGCCELYKPSLVFLHQVMKSAVGIPDNRKFSFHYN